MSSTNHYILFIYKHFFSSPPISIYFLSLNWNLLIKFSLVIQSYNINKTTHFVLASAQNTTIYISQY